MCLLYVGEKRMTEKRMTGMTLALQLYTVRDETARDFAGTLRRVAEIGYGAVEFAGYGDLSSDALKGLLAETGLRAASTHVSLTALEDNLEREIDYCRAIDCSYLVLPWLAPDQRDVDSLRALAPRLDEFGRRCRAHGITFAYHNHDFEFATAEGQRLLDILLDNTDPDLVALELDVYWAAYAGVDPVALLQRRAGRVPLVHLKDMAADRSFTEVGDGTLNLKAIWTAAEKSGARWYIVENDRPLIPSLQSARRSLENARTMGISQQP